jgi:hypothetical protein
VSLSTPPEAPADVAPIRANLALSFVVLSWFIWVCFQTTQLARDQSRLNQLKAGQELALQESAKVRSQIEGLAADTAKLAAQGHAGAQAIMAELQKRGVRIDVPKTTPPGK